MRLRKRRRGAAMVEMAIVVPLLIALMAGIIDIGWLYNHQLMLTNAAREGARLGSLNYTEEEVEDGVLDYLTQSQYSPIPAAGDIDITFPDDSIQVSIDSTVPLLIKLMGASWNLNATAKMRVE